MNDVLKLPRIQGKPLEVIVSPQYKADSYYRGKPHLEDHVLDIVDAIVDGKQLPSWAYRSGIDDNCPPDRMLSRYGIMHLHLGAKNSNDLLLLMQFDDHVVILAIGNHRHFIEDPPGSLLYKFHKAKVEEINKLREQQKLQEEASAALEAAAKLEEKSTAIKSGLLPRKHATQIAKN
ncbi:MULTISPECIES: hypothetical protein [unclassified Agrobacterium]|jgi:hypothetical protein